MIREDGLLKYPRTPHLEGSRLQAGDSAHDQLPLASLSGAHVVLEEKMDGANCGVSFSQGAELRLQSRGHFLTGGSRERHFNRFKQWAAAHEAALFDVLGTRFIMFGEWMGAKHAMYYDALPHLFLEFDIFDREDRVFLSTPRRHALLAGLPVVSVPVVHEGEAPPTPAALVARMGPSLGRTPHWRQSLAEQARRQGLDADRVLGQTDPDDRIEGFYGKVEDDERVLSRFKFIRASFTQAILDTGEHWQSRPIVPNALRPGVDIFAPAVDKAWSPASPAGPPRP